MGAWGAGLYSDDSALDLRAAIAAMSRLPWDGAAILAELRRSNISADDPEDESHTIFWLVTADQFAKRGIECVEATNRALDLIETGRDISLMSELGLPPSDQRKRQKKLMALAAFLREPKVKTRRKIMSAPDPMLMPANSVWRYPVSKGNPRNPYFASAEAERFAADGWGAMLVLDCGRAFDWIGWYLVAPLRLTRKDAPGLEQIPEARLYTSRVHRWDDAVKDYVNPARITGGPGTLSRTHMKRMELDCLGEWPIDRNRIPDYLKEFIVHAVVSDTSICSRLNVTLSEGNGPEAAEWLIQSPSG